MRATCRSSSRCVGYTPRRVPLSHTARTEQTSQPYTLHTHPSQVFDDSHLTHDELMGAADLTIDTALLDSLVQRTQHAPHAAPAGAHAPAAGDAAHAPSSAHDSAPLDFTVPLATKHRGLHHVGDYFTHHHRVKGGHKTHPTISLSLSAKLTPPSTFEVLVLMCRPLFMRVKAFLVYQRMPYDRTVFSKMRDPAWWGAPPSP